MFYEQPLATEIKLHFRALEKMRPQTCHPTLPSQVADDCSMLPLALSMAGAMARDHPLDASSWRTVHEALQENYIKLKEMRQEEMTPQSMSIFSTIDASVENLPRAVREKLYLMVVLASGVTANSEMLASLWDVVRSYQYLPVWCVALYTSPLGVFLCINRSITAINPAACVSVVPPYRE